MTLFNAVIRIADPGARRAVLVDPDGLSWCSCLQVARVSRRRALGPWGHDRRLLRGPDRLVRVCDHQLGADRDPGHRPRRNVLCAARPLAVAEELGAAHRQARRRHHSDRRPGVSDPRGACRAGSVNTLAGWVRNRTHRLSRWEATLPSMTSASQAGILHGTNDGIPAFRWYERDRKHLMVSSNPLDAAEIVRRLSNGEGLLSNDGVSICNLLTGDAAARLSHHGGHQAEGSGDRRDAARSRRSSSARPAICARSRCSSASSPRSASRPVEPDARVFSRSSTAG